jgi:hypothetical protein
MLAAAAGGGFQERRGARSVQNSWRSGKVRRTGQWLAGMLAGGTFALFGQKKEGSEFEKSTKFRYTVYMFVRNGCECRVSRIAARRACNPYEGLKPAQGGQMAP